MKKNNDLWVLGHRISPVKVTGNYDMVVGETAPNVPGPPPHLHTGMDELFMVLEGEMEFIVNGKATTVSKGESIDLPSNTIHTFRNAGSDTCKWVNIHSPKGFWSFFKEMGVPVTESEAMQRSVDEKIINKVMAEAANYDMHIKFELSL